jgi:hypothetical protein
LFSFLIEANYVSVKAANDFLRFLPSPPFFSLFFLLHLAYYYRILPLLSRRGLINFVGLGSSFFLLLPWLTITDFSRRCSDEGLIFVGPGPESINAMGSKAEAKRLLQDPRYKNSVPVIPGYNGLDQSEDIFVREAVAMGKSREGEVKGEGGGEEERERERDKRRGKRTKARSEGAGREGGRKGWDSLKTLGTKIVYQ